jgi:hypothetical protein
VPALNMRLNALKGIARCLARRASTEVAGPLRPRARRPQLERDLLGSAGVICNCP